MCILTRFFTLGSLQTPSSKKVGITNSTRSLFPDTVYGLDSGGDPRHIPDLTYADFKAFHQRYYHPSNARLFFFGDDDFDERLRLLDSWLCAFDPIAVDSMVTAEKSFSAPRRLSRTFAAGAEKSDRKAMATVNWMIDQIPDTETDLGVGILEYILIGTPASPLRKALVDSGLGEDIAGRGLDDELLQPMISVGLKGIDRVTPKRSKQSSLRRSARWPTKASTG